MISVSLEPARERQLAEIATSQGVSASQLAQRVLEEFLDLQAWQSDTDDDWAAASVALTDQIFESEDWGEESARDEPE